MIEAIILIVIVAVAVWYLLRRFTAAVKAENPSCGCGGCEGCPAGPVKIEEKLSTDCNCNEKQDEEDR